MYITKFRLSSKCQFYSGYCKKFSIKNINPFDMTMSFLSMLLLSGYLYCE